MAVKRDWREALRKRNHEGRCRACGAVGSLECAHVIGRAHDPVVEREEGGVALKSEKVRLVKPESIVVLCAPCHRAYDRRELDILSALSLEEQCAAVEAAGGVYSMVKRVTSGEML